MSKSSSSTSQVMCWQRRQKHAHDVVKMSFSLLSASEEVGEIRTHSRSLIMMRERRSSVSSWSYMNHRWVMSRGVLERYAKIIDFWGGSNCLSQHDSVLKTHDYFKFEKVWQSLKHLKPFACSSEIERITEMKMKVNMNEGGCVKKTLRN